MSSSKTRIALICFFVLFTSAAQSRCILPAPDGADIVPSPANLEGTISAIKGSAIVVRELNSKKKVSVLLAKGSSIYTAFGGAFYQSDLKVGQRAWVWFVGCKRPSKGVAKSAYFQIYSTDPNDRP